MSHNSVYLFNSNVHMGPLQISLGRMLFDISKFLFIYFLVLFAFANGLNQLYYNYGNNGTVTTNSPHAIIPSKASIYNMSHIVWLITRLLGSSKDYSMSFWGLISTLDHHKLEVFGNTSTCYGIQSGFSGQPCS